MSRPRLDSYHQHEVLDRLYVLRCTLGEHVESHPFVDANPEIQQKIVQAGKLLGEACFEVDKVVLPPDVNELNVHPHGYTVKWEAYEKMKAHHDRLYQLLDELDTHFGPFHKVSHTIHEALQELANAEFSRVQLLSTKKEPGDGEHHS